MGDKKQNTFGWSAAVESEDREDRAWQEEREARLGDCKYNKFVDCPPHKRTKCASCGWNPRVADSRKADVRQELAKLAERKRSDR